MDGIDDPRVAQLAGQYGADPAVIAQVLASSPGARITSGARDPVRNAAVKGVPTSKHLTGEAVDFVDGDPAHMQQEAQGFSAPGFREIYEPAGPHSTAPHLHVEKVSPEAIAAAKAQPADPAWALTGLGSADLGQMLQQAQNSPEMQEARAEYVAAKADQDAMAEQMKKDFPAMQALRERRLANLKNQPDMPAMDRMRDEVLPPIRDPMQALSQTMPMLALLAGAFNKRYAVGAMNAATAAMNAQKMGDYAARQQAHEAWLDDTKKLLENNSIKLQEYQNALDRNHNNDAALKAEMELIAAKWDDLGMMAKIHEGNFANVEKLLQIQERAMNPVAKIYAAAASAANKSRPEEYADQNGNPVLYDREKREWQDSHGNPLGYVPKGLVKLGSQPRGSVQIQLLNQYRQDYQAKHGGANPSPEEEERFLADYGAKGKAARDFSPGGPIGKKITSFNVAIAHLEVLDGLITALGNGDVHEANVWRQRYQAQTGHSAPTNFEAAKSIVGDELVKAIVGGAGALGDREEAKKQLDLANSPQQLRKAIETYKKLMVGQIEGAKNDFVTQGVGLEEEFNRRLMPETKKALGLLEIPPDQMVKYQKIPLNRKAAAKEYLKSKGYDVSGLN